MKKTLAIFFISVFAFSQASLGASASDSINAYLFYGDGCPHCAKEMRFLEDLRKEYPSLEIKNFEIYRNKDNALLLQRVGKSLNADVSGVPFSVIGDKHFVGYAEGITSEEIKSKIKECRKSGCPDQVASIISSGKQEEQENKQNKNFEKNSSGKKINLPIFGKIDTQKFSLPILTMIMGFLDGFNPCAMWTLLFLISLLLGMKDRKRMWILGTAFIVASASVYFLFMSAWLNLILFLGFVVWVRIVIGILALFGGGYSLKKFLFDKDSGCAVANDESRQRVFQKLKKLVGKNSFWIALGGIIGLAFMVNLVELICSAGLPAVYTQVLAINELSRWQYYLYILFYVFFFMLDDLLVFFMAMITLEMTGLSTKYSRYSQLIGGTLMFIIGILLIFKPQWLMFG
jgi:thiol-disulfide isomerase/thioredoxin